MQGLRIAADRNFPLNPAHPDFKRIRLPHLSITNSTRVYLDADVRVRAMNSAIRNPQFEIRNSRVVAGEGIEPPTRGFSVLCSTN